MDRIPFSVYDFFGYLSAGSVLLAGVAAAFAGSVEWQESPSVVVAVLLVIAAYSAGHVVANVSGHLIENLFVGRVLGAPTKNLFVGGRDGLWQRIFPGYFRPLPALQRERVLERARETAGVREADEGLFFHCFGRVKSREDVIVRLSTFLNLYGFCRNMALALALVAIAITAGSVATDSADTGDLIPPGWIAISAGVAAIGLLYRYLKFFRHYAVEVFVSYAEGVDANA